ncbi:beta-lactamase [Usnea florida]
MEEQFETACKDGTIPGAILLASNRSGIFCSFHYARTFGVRSLDTQEPLEMDNIMCIASCTKLMTSIATMQCVERGLVALDTDVAKVLPELAAQGILTGFDEASGEPIIQKRQKNMTLRHLLTHSAGLCYLPMSQRVQRYRRHTKNFKIGTGATVEEACTQPLIYEPGTDWCYSTSIDWAGKLIERITGQTLEEYMTTYIWRPLGIKDMTFWPDEHPDMKSRMTSMTIRDEASGKVIPDQGSAKLPGGIDCFGGHGAFASMPDYFKILHSLLLDDETLLKRSTTAQMFQPQLTKESQRAQKSLMANPANMTLFVGEFPKEIPLDWGIGGILTLEADEAWRGKHTLIWSGMPNLFWFIDRETNLCGLYGGQVLPPGDAKVGKMITLFEKTMYQRNAAQTSRARM